MTAAPMPVADSRRTETSMLGPVLGLATFVALGLLVPFLVLAEPDHYRSRGWIVTLAILILSAVRLAVLVGRGQRRLFEFIFWLFCYVFFGLGPTVQMRQDMMPGTTRDLDPMLDLPTAELALAGVLSMALGFVLANPRRRPRVGQRALKDSLLTTLSVSRWRLVLLSAVGVGGSLYYVAKVGTSTLFGSRVGTGLVEDQLWPDPSVAGIVRAISSFPILIAAHGWWIVASLQRDRTQHRIVATVLSALTLLVTNPVSSSRYASGVVWGSFLGPAGAYANRRRISVTLVSIIGSLLFLFPVADLFRRVGQVNVERTGFLGEYAGNGDYDAFGQLSNALLYSQTEKFQFARQFLGQVFFWVPRSIWVDKPTGTGVLLAQFRGYSFTNLSAPIWAEMLLNFGIVGVVLVSILMGYALGRLDRAFSEIDVPGPLGIATSLLPFYLLIVLRGSLLQATGSLVVIVASLVFISARPEDHRHRGRAASTHAVPQLTAKGQSGAGGNHET